MKKLFALLMMVSTFLLISGCASVEMESTQKDQQAKQFLPPSEGMSGLYIYRDSFLGKSLKKDIYIDDQLIGESAPDIYFYREVSPGEHKVSTESEFSDNALQINTKEGEHTFLRQYMKIGIFFGGAALELIEESKAKNDILKLKRAKTIDGK